MTPQTNKATVEWITAEVFNTGKLVMIEQVAVHDLCVHYPQASKPLCGLEQVKHSFSRARAAFADAYFMTEDTIAADDRVVTHWTGRATHIGSFWGVPPTGQQILWRGVTIYRFAADTIVEVWIYADILQLLQQLDPARAMSRSGPRSDSQLGPELGKR